MSRVLACTMSQKRARIHAPCPVDIGNRQRQRVSGAIGQANARHRPYLPGVPSPHRRKSGRAPLIRHGATCVEAGAAVVDDFPAAIPVAPRELEVIETYLSALL